ncbi:uncharacterized protein FTJAE_7528 [Fusarium tjaetaba]|uniref:Major facilitator superfamily (MFS) profile domain-containing protein n=1 Tax=Fusarium tjaetaba TaxID=1567544 RepID=A0A8H5VS21_9HYPO|nr:uncharacterized protein FTJAE_7528 [Fusarium tjaetaba]KAF5632418.1 hypothetical protein FTJAE_7528 [Fusarium tjaetaba]
MHKTEKTDMGTQAVPPDGYPAEITGYIDPWIASPGNSVEVKISSTERKLKYRVVRLIHGPQGSDTSGMKQEAVNAIPSGTCRGRYQIAHPGSYAIINQRDYNITPDTGLEFTFYFQPHLVEAKHYQTLISTLDVEAKTGYAVVLTDQGLLEFWVGTGDLVEVVPTHFKPELQQWVKVTFTIQGSLLNFSIFPHPFFASIPQSPVMGSSRIGQDIHLSTPSSLVFAASFALSPDQASHIPTNFFNGRLDSLVMKSSCKVAEWDFSLEMSTDKIIDVSGNGAHGRLVNCPTRAVTGHDWDGLESDWTKAKYGYGAIHFHEDDLDDASWGTDFAIQLPDTLRSGVYAVELEAVNGAAKDSIPFFIRPTAATSQALGPEIVYVLSTFTYLAYANEHVYDRGHIKDRVSTRYKVIPDTHAEKTVRRNDLGLSTYDIHNDRSGVIYSTAKRPIMNMRPDYISWNLHRPRGLSADLLMLEFLERSGNPYDVVCDHDLHTHGYSSISRYGTIITGSHPEYHTTESLKAYMDFIKSGGNVMYLGGNGFYWSCATTSENIHRVEIRRGGEGVRPFTCAGGDRVFSSNGQSGLLWRSRGLPSNAFLGVGSCAAGPGPGVPYKRTEASKESKFTWMFDGIQQDELLGEYGFGGGASGDEIDKCDYEVGSPAGTIILATSTGHSEEFAMFPEDVIIPFKNVLGTQTREVRSDMTYYETSGGGAVFSVGSMNWLCSLGWNRFDNNVALITGNVLREFVRRQSSYGVCRSMVNGLNILPVYAGYFKLNETTMGVSTAAIFIGGCLATPCSGIFCDRMGRRPAIFWGSIIAITGMALQGVAQNLAMFVIARILIGFGAAIANISSGTYLSETFPSLWRSWGVSMLNNFYYIGALIIAVVTLATSSWDSTWAWRTPSITQTVFSLLCILILPFIPESPRWLIHHDQSEAARLSAALVVSNGDIEDPVANSLYEKIVQGSKLVDSKNPNTAFWSIMKDAVARRRLLIGASVGVFSSISGNLIATFYLGTALETAGVTETKSQLKANIALNAWCFPCAIVGTQVISQWGRKSTAAVTEALLVICLVLIGILSKLYADDPGNASTGLVYANVAIMFLFQGIYSIAWTPLFTVYPPEIASFSMRAHTVGLSQLALNILSVIFVLIMPTAFRNIGWKLYIINASWDVLVVVFILYFWVETKGKTLEEINILFEKKASRVPPPTETRQLDTTTAMPTVAQLSHASHERMA